jgi:hypothetical protein
VCRPRSLACRSFNCLLLQTGGIEETADEAIVTLAGGLSRKQPGKVIAEFQSSSMASTISSLFYAYAQQLALHSLSRISGAQLKIILQYQDPPEVIQVGIIDGPEQPESSVTLIVRNPNLWMRICSCFDLVRHNWLHPNVEMLSLTRLIISNRGFQRHTYSRKSTVTTWVNYSRYVHSWSWT